MAATPSAMVPLGTPLPDFSLPDTNGRMVGPADFKDKPALLVMFICNHCPFVKHLREGIASFARDMQPRGLGIIAINSNDAAKYPEDSPENMRREVAAAGYSFPYLFDETQQVAKSFRAACTPDFFLYDRDRKLFYRGQFDDSRPSKYVDGRIVPVTGKDLRAAVEAVLAGKPPPQPQTPSLGCNIKWKPGNEPQW